MPLKNRSAGEFRVESENTRTTIRIFKGAIRVFSCEITANSIDQARITNANGNLDHEIKSQLLNWLMCEGYTLATYERLKKINGIMAFKTYTFKTQG